METLQAKDLTALQEITPNGKAFDTSKLFRLPWSLSDNAMTWLEPTRKCNIVCDACFHMNDPLSQKSLEQIELEVKTMLKLRRCDAMLIAGGEPLTHPNIAEITRIVKSYGVKPVLITNGVGLNRSKIHRLKEAGMHGFTFHIDSHQHRPGWRGKTETELNELRQEFADMLAEEGGLSCAYNMTVFPDTLKDVPAVVEWAAKNIDKVNIMTLIPVRMVSASDPYNFYAGGERIAISDTPYLSKENYRDLTAPEVYDEILKALPDFKFNAYLGGTALPATPKWIIGNHLGTKERFFGNMGPKTMELLQNVYHMFAGSYLAYAKPSLSRKAKLMFFFSLFDKELRKTAGRFFREAFRNPSLFLKNLHIQSISVVQPVDILPNGEKDNCDGCPNMTYWEGRLVAACRLEEYLIYGGPISVTPKDPAENGKEASVS